MTSLLRTTILTAAYNASRFLERYARGVRCQQYANTELVYVDDGSEDNTYEYVLSLLDSGAFGPISYHILRQDNQGPHAAMNRGLEVATGDLILPVDADDMLLPGAIEAFVEAFGDNPEADLVYADYRKCDESFRRLPPEPQRNKWISSKNLLWSLLEHGMFIPAGSYCYRRRCLELLPNKRFTVQYHAQNLELLLHAAANAKCVYIPKETVEIMVRPNSRSRACTLERLRRKVTGSAVLQREVARTYGVPWQVRLRLERRLVGLDVDYYFLTCRVVPFLVACAKAACLGALSRKHISQLAAIFLPSLRSRVVCRYFDGYALS